MARERTTARPIILKGGRNIAVDGTCQVYIEVIHYFSDGKKRTAFDPVLGIRVKPQHWNSKECKVTRYDTDNVNKNYRIFCKLGEVKDELNGIKKGNPIVLSKIATAFTPPQKTIIDYFDEYIEFRKRKIKASTKRSYNVIRSRLNKYMLDTYPYKLYFKDMTITFADNFENWLTDQGYSEATIGKSFKVLKTFLQHYYERKDEQGIVMNDKFQSKRFKRGKEAKNEPNPLSELQFSILKSHTFKTFGRNQHKDRFLWQCSTGLRYSDAFCISSEHIFGKCIEYHPKKTEDQKDDNKVIIPINNTARNLLQRYNYDMTRLSISNQKYNVGLSDMFDELIEKYPENFDEPFSSHSGRDTYITYCLNNGIDVPSLMKMVGHSSWDMMKRYFKVDKDKMVEKMQKVEIFI